MPRARCRSLLPIFALAVLVAAPARAQVAAWPAERPPRPLAARDVTFPPYEVRAMDNGLRVVVVQHDEQPVVSLRMLIRAGAAADPKEPRGVAAMTAALLDQGTTGKSAVEVASAIDSIGGRLATGAGSDLTYVDVLVMKDSLTFGFDMLADIVRRPAFRAEELERQRQQALSGLQVSYRDPDYVAGLVFDRLVYGFHPYGLPNTGTPESLKAITPEDLRAFHETWFVPNNAILAIVGDVSAEEAFAGVERVFADWASRDLPKLAPASPPEPTRRVLVINKPDAVQTEVRVGQLGIARTDPDYLAFDLAMKILGGEGANRLHRVLRSERGLTYGASAEMQALKQAGDFVADTDTRSDATAEVLRLIVEEIARLRRERVSERELDDAKAYLAGNFPLSIETPDAIAAQVLNVLFYGLPLDEIENYRERVNAISPDDIQRVAQQYLRPDRLSVVLVGNAKAFADELPKVGFPTFEQVNLPDLDLTSVTFQRSAERPAAAAAH